MKFLAIATALCVFAINTAAVDHKPFHWQWRQMDHDFYRRPIIRQMKINHDFLVEITDDIVDSMRPDKDFFGDTGDAELFDLASDESYQWADLDGDGVPELITGGFGVDQCGGTGNCILQVFRRHGSKLELILSTSAESLMIDRSGSKPLLVLYTHSSAIEGELSVYSFPRSKKATVIHHYDVTWAPFDPSKPAYHAPHLERLSLTR
ncbi:MAG: hypothetical protein WB439_03960 [Acidobacteriaceae bacterium]